MHRYLHLPPLCHLACTKCDRRTGHDRIQGNERYIRQPSNGESKEESAQGLHLIRTYNQATAEGCAAVAVETRLVANARHITVRTMS